MTSHRAKVVLPREHCTWPSHLQTSMDPVVGEKLAVGIEEDNTYDPACPLQVSMKAHDGTFACTTVTLAVFLYPYTH